MQRRKYLAAIGSLAAGGAAAAGTGAFTSVEADRTVNVAVADDANAYLGLATTSSPNSQDYVDDSGQQIVLNLDETDNGGSGFNADAETRIDDLLQVTNQGTQTINVWVTLSGGTEFDDDTLYFYPGDATDTALNNGEGNDDGNDVLALTPGESAKLGVLVELGDVSDVTETPTATFHADVEAGSEGESTQTDDSGGSFATVSNDGTGDFDTQEGDVEGQTVTNNPLQAAINNASGSTIVLKNTDEPIDVPEPLTIPAGKNGLELRGLDGKPTIRYIGGQADGQQGINIFAPDVTFENLDFEIYPGRDGIGRNSPFTGGTSGITLRNTGLTIRNTDMTLEAEDGVSFDSASVRLFQVLDTEDKGDGTITIENSSFASNSGADGLVRTAQFFQGPPGTFLNQSTPFTDENGNVVDRSVTITGCTFGDGSGTQAHSGEGQSVEITGCTFTGSGNINGYPEGDVTISGNDFIDADNELDIQFASVPDVVNGTDVEEGRTKGANAAARTFGQNNTDVSVRVQRDEFDAEGNRVTVAGPATFPSGSS
jgi:hypothetical protein